MGEEEGGERMRGARLVRWGPRTVHVGLHERMPGDGWAGTPANFELGQECSTVLHGGEPD